MQIFIKDDKKNRGKWTSPRKIIDMNKEAGTLTVPGRSGRVFLMQLKTLVTLGTKENFQLQYKNRLMNLILI